MSDNVPITPGTGSLIAADEVIDPTLGTVKVQYVKIMDGTLDGTTKLGVGVNGLKVDISTVSTEATLAAIKAKTDNLDVLLSTRTKPADSQHVTIDNSMTANAGTNLNTSLLALDSTVAKDASLTILNTSVNTLLKPGSTLTKVTTIDTITNPIVVTGVATSVNQTTGNASLSSMDSKLTLSNGRLQVENAPISNLLGVSVTGVTGASVTLTLPAVAGLFHYIDSIEVSLYSTAARTGVATPILVTTTNLPGNSVSTWATSAAIGQCDTRQLNDATLSIKSSIANTATTFVAPAVTGGLWRMNVIYNAAV